MCFRWNRLWYLFYFWLIILVYNMESLFFFVIAVALAYAVGCWGSTRKIGFGWEFGLSLINLFIGIIAVACSKKKEKEEKSIEQ